MGIVSEFKKFNADLKNPNWSVSSISSNNELIVSLWGHNLYCLNTQLKENRSIVTVLIDGSDFQNILEGKDGSQYPKRFNAKTNWIGKLTVWDGTQFEIVFRLDQ